MIIETLIEHAHRLGASDLHLEPGQPQAVRVRGRLQALGPALGAAQSAEIVSELLSAEDRAQLEARGSFDFSRNMAGVRCRINLMRTSRGVGLAARLLRADCPTFDELNLHPDLCGLLGRRHGLMLVCGPTGSGKSSTLAACLQELNLSESLHIISLESPIEYVLAPKKCLIRQREVGRDTPSFERAILDSLREDPDVLVVGELREPETMRLALNAAETGRLVLATLHSGSCAEALQRIIGAFPAEIQDNIAAALADGLTAVIAQRLVYIEKHGGLAPECEILRPTAAVKAHIRSREFFKLKTAFETGAEEGLWTFRRYRRWLDERLLQKPLGERVVIEAAPDPGAAAPEAPSAPPSPRIEIAPFHGEITGMLRKRL